MDQYAVMGNPVNHSKSPAIHTTFAKQTNQILEYRCLHVEIDGFENAVNSFFTNKGKGLNITLPFKEAAWQLASKRSEEAELAGAVNTLFLDEAGMLNGYNTDGIGLVRDILQNHKGALKGKSILVLGAGGASRGILLPLLKEKPEKICIANRTVEKAEELGKKFSKYGLVIGCGFSALTGQHYDWVINASSASLEGKMPPLPEGILSPGAWCYDLMYSSAETVFCQWAKQAGAEKSLDGLGMLIEQAAESFFLWRGVRPDTQSLLSNFK